MADYTKLTDFSQKDTVQALIEGVDFDNEFTAVSQMSTTKTDKITPAAANSVAGLNSAGNLIDSGILISDVATALNETVAVATVLPYAGSSPPAGYLFADGKSYLTSSYPDLFGVIGYTYGGSGANFNVPDLRGRTIAAQDNMGGTSANRITNAQADVLGGSMGAEKHTLSESEMPSHTHTIQNDTHSHPGYNPAPCGTGNTTGWSVGACGGGANRDTGQRTGNDTHSHTANSAGGGASHNNVQPTLFLNYIIKT